MTVWGSTPTCRGFDHFAGFYSAATDYWSHDVGGHPDLRNDTRPDASAFGYYSTELFTQRAQAWIKRTLQRNPSARTFAYVAHEAVHGPLDAPQHYVDGPCSELVPADWPERRTYCAMVRAMDDSVGNLTRTYQELGIWNDTLVIMTADNGGQPLEGGNNFPLRGCKATVWEGGVRGASWIAGAGIAPKQRGKIGTGLMHVTDWLPTLVSGAAGGSTQPLGRPCPTCTTPVYPLDGVNQWPMLSQGAASARNEALLELHSANKCINRGAKDGSGGGCRLYGEAAIRVGDYKLIRGSPLVYGATNGGDKSGTLCAVRSGATSGLVAHSCDAHGNPNRIAVPPNESHSWCPTGWLPPPQARDKYQAPQPPPTYAHACTVDGNNASYCRLPANATLFEGGIWLFNVVKDPTERENLAGARPDLVAKLMQRLETYNATNTTQQPGTRDPHSTPKLPGGFWTPWRGNPDPSRCDTNKTDPYPPPPAPPGPSPLHSSLNAPASRAPKSTASQPVYNVKGWAWDATFPGGGAAPVTVRLLVDKVMVGPPQRAMIPRPGVPATGAPNAQHGFEYVLKGEAGLALGAEGTHVLIAQANMSPDGKTGSWVDLGKGPVTYVDGKRKVAAREAAAAAEEEEEEVVVAEDVNVVLSPRPPLAPSLCTFIPRHMDLDGNDLLGPNGRPEPAPCDTPQECCSMCAAKDPKKQPLGTCRAFSWNNHSKTCWMKSANSTHPDLGSSDVSGTVP